ncbi:hypothetical protein DIPPA_04190 [Diplonema papillatum]|nr:hypothetical protein DIPPA_04190 [Diplonema papillatum]
MRALAPSVSRRRNSLQSPSGSSEVFGSRLLRARSSSSAVMSPQPASSLDGSLAGNHGGGLVAVEPPHTRLR